MLQCHLGNFIRTLALPEAFPMAEVAIPKDLFANILRRIDRLRPNPLPT
jgi:hypothetical protein